MCTILVSLALALSITILIFSCSYLILGFKAVVIKNKQFDNGLAFNIMGNLSVKGQLFFSYNVKIYFVLLALFEKLGVLYNSFTF